MFSAQRIYYYNSPCKGPSYLIMAYFILWALGFAINRAVPSHKRHLTALMLILISGLSKQPRALKHNGFLLFAVGSILT